MNNHQIIKSLCDYYDRAVKINPDIPEYGFTFEEIHYSVVIDLNGNFLELKKHNKNYNEAVPAKNGNQKDTTFLWGKPKFVLGIAMESVEYDKDGGRFLDKLIAFPHKNKYIEAVICYLENNISIYDFSGRYTTDWDIMCDNANSTVCNIIFEVKEKKEYIKPHQTKEVIDNADWNILSDGRMNAYCPVSDESSPVSILHSKSGSYGTFVSYDKDAYQSYGFDRGMHCSISSLAAHKYFQAVTEISKENSVYIGGLDGIRVLIWTDCDENPNAYVKEILSIFNAKNKIRHSTKFDPDDGDVNCYILGVKKNMGRCSYEFFEVIKLSALYDNLNKFLDQTRYMEYNSQDYIQIPLLDIVDNYIKTSMSENPQEKTLITSMFIKTLLCGGNGGKLPSQFLRNFSIRLEEKVRSGKNISKKSAVVAKFLLDNCVPLSKTMDNCQYQKEYDKMAEEMNVGEAYGRAYALYEKMYRKYLQDTGEKNSSIDYKVRVFRMKYFARAMKNPNVIVSELPQYFSRILHSVCRDGGGLYFFFENKIKGLLSGMNPAKKTYTSVEIAAFAVGYNDESQYKKKTEDETI